VGYRSVVWCVVFIIIEVESYYIDLSYGLIKCYVCVIKEVMHGILI
jgi:hypothetical protein